MLDTFECFVALRYLRSKRKEVFISIITVISVLGVALSVMVLNMVLAIMTGFETELRDKLLDANAHVVVRRYGDAIDDWEKLEKDVKTVPGVAAVFPYTYNQALITSSTGSRGVLIRGVVNEQASREKIAKTLLPGDSIDHLFSPPMVEVERPDGTIDQVKLPPLILGRALRNSLNLTPLSPVTVMSPQLSSSPQGMIPRFRRFLYAGTYSSGLMEYETGLAYTSLTAAQEFFSMGNSVSAIEVVLQDVSTAKDVAKLIAEKLKNVDDQLYVSDWTETHKPLWKALELEKKVYFIVLLLLILVASFSIVSTLVMVVMEKSRDIAIMKTMGATDRSIMNIFLLQSAIVGFLGIALGSLLGYIGCVTLREYGFEIDAQVFSMDRVPVKMSGVDFALVAGAALIITSLAGLYPARRAAKLRPAEALRFE